MKFLEMLQKRFYKIGAARLGLLFTVGLLSTLYPAFPSRAQTYQGFGAVTLGGAGKPVYHVINLNDSGPGSLRDALSLGDRDIVFDIKGQILLQSRLIVQGANITIDGLTALAPGITLKNHGLFISGEFGAHDVIVSGIRVHIVSDVPEEEDGITIIAGAYNVVIDHVSIRGASDESIGINNAHDVTVSWSILADPISSHNSNMLITNGAYRLSVHHNLFLKSSRRNPWVAWQETPDQIPGEAPEVQADVRNNLMWDVSGIETDHGTVVFAGGKANIVNNYYKAATALNNNARKRVTVICKEFGTTDEDMSFCKSRLNFSPGRAYVTGNFSADGFTSQINAKGTETEPFPAPPIDTTEACAAAQQVVANAGVKPRDTVEQQYLSAITLQPCDGTEPSAPQITSPEPGSVLPGSKVTFGWSIPAGMKVKNWRIFIGSTRGANDIYDTGKFGGTTSTFKNTSGLPTDGRTIWVQLRFELPTGWQFADFQSTAAPQ